MTIDVETTTDSPVMSRDMTSAIAYLLLTVLNLQKPPMIGTDGNRTLTARFFDILKAQTPRIFCDVGANDGSTAIEAKRLFPSCQVFSFEANPNIHQFHSEKLRAAGVDTRNLAVCATEASITIFEPTTLSRAFVDGQIVPATIVEPPNTGKSSLLRRDETATYREHLVKGTTLDHFLGDHIVGGQTRDVALWIDVEGAAYDVLSGAALTLDRTSAIFIETENFQFWKNQKQSGELSCFLISKGFLPIQRDREYGDKQFNIVFVHASLLAYILPHLFDLSRSLPQTHGRIIQSSTKPRSARPYKSLGDSMISEIPVCIPTFNNPTYASAMINQLFSWNVNNIFVIDNASTSPDMIHMLDRMSVDVKVIRLESNYGPHRWLTRDENLALLPEIFCVTDPDLLFNPDMPQGFLYTLLMQTHKHAVGKAGLALDIHDRTTMRADKFIFAGAEHTIWDWESQFWLHPLEKTQDHQPVYKASIDTTFALYNKKYFNINTFYEAVRVAGSYTCRHLPWYYNNGLPSDEENFYRKTQKFSYHMT